jgi:hypothetical protein
MGLGARFCIGYLIPNFVLIGMMRLMSLLAICIYIFCKTLMTFMIYMVDILVIILVFVFCVYDL